MADLGSTEGLGNLGRTTSRSSLSFVSTGADDILDKLRYLNYVELFCNPNNMLPLHRFSLMYEDINPNLQYYRFILLCKWLLDKLHVEMSTPGQFDDPNATAANLVAALKKAGVNYELGSSKLKQGYGDGPMIILQSLVDAVMVDAPPLQKPIHGPDEYAEEAEVDHNAEVTTEAMDEVDANFEEDDMFLNTIKTKTEPAREKDEKPIVDPVEWRLEVERVAPLLKLKIGNENKDWRVHAQQMEYHHQKIKEFTNNVKGKLTKLHDEIESSLEKIASREKYVNAQFLPQTEKLKSIQENASNIRQKISTSSNNVTDLSRELAAVSEDLDSIKARMDEIGSGMTDSKPLVAIKQGVVTLKSEIKQMNLRIGVIENTLLNAKLKDKGISDDFSVQVLSYY